MQTDALHDSPVADAESKNETVPFSSGFGWSAQPTVTMGLNPHMPPVPNGYAGTQYADWPYAIPWMVVFPDSVASAPKNAGVVVRNMLLQYWNTQTLSWHTLYSGTPMSGQDHNSAFSETQAGSFSESSLGKIVRPPYGFCTELWGSRQPIAVAAIGGIYASVEHRLLDVSDTDRWCVQMGADYWPGLGGYPDVVPYNPGIGTGRIKRVMGYWRKASFLIAGVSDVSKI